MTSTTPVIEVESLKVRFTRPGFSFRRSSPGKSGVWALDDVSFQIRGDECLGIAGETGSGKSTLAKILVGLYAPTEGVVRLMGERVNYSSRDDVRRLRRTVGLVLQDPFNSLNPRLKVADIIKEALIAEKTFPSRNYDSRVLEVSELVGLRRSSLDSYPRQLSGGEKQRVSIARAIAVPKKLLILDEPTSSLDVSVQAQVLNTLKRLRKELGLSYLFITHDIGVLKFMCDRVGILFYGKLMEIGDVAHVLSQPAHPYTRELVRQSFDQEAAELAGEPIEHSPAGLGCKFSKLCPHVFHKCVDQPPMFSVGTGQSAACFLYSHIPPLLNRQENVAP